MEKIYQRDSRGGSRLVRLIHQRHHETLLIHAAALCKQFQLRLYTKDDILQDFYITVMSRGDVVAKGYEEAGIAYLKKMLCNTVLDLRRKKESVGRLNEIYAEQKAKRAGLHSFCLEVHTEQFLRDISRHLSERAFGVMKLYIEGYSYKEIEERTGINHNTVGTIIHRSKDTLSPILRGRKK